MRCPVRQRQIKCHTSKSTVPFQTQVTSMFDRRRLRVNRPCKKHLSSARERYASTLEALGCICKALLALNLETCCTPKRSPFEMRDIKHTGQPANDTDLINVAMDSSLNPCTNGIRC